MDYSLVCTHCGTRYSNKLKLFRCDKCSSILEVSYKYPSKIKLAGEKITHVRYKALFPLHSKLLTLREGGTPSVSYKLDGVNLHLKLETHNPTNSFKDRGSSIEISKAKELGFKEVCCASTGNMGLSTAAYAEKFGLKCHIFISKDANKKKIEKIKKRGAEIVEVEGDFNTALETAELFAKENGVFLCGDYHYRKEGQKSIAYELVEQSAKPLDFIFLPVGNGTLLAAVFKGLNEFKRFGLLRKLPRLVAVQAKGCNPLVRAFKDHVRIKYQHPKTIADAIAVGYPTFGFEGLEALKKTNGIAVSIKDEELLSVKKKLAITGILAESGGTAAFAGFLKLYKEHPMRFKNKNVACIITGNNE